jgi:hypothetical protein
MSPPHPDIELLTTRIAKLSAAYNACDTEKALTVFQIPPLIILTTVPFLLLLLPPPPPLPRLQNQTGVMALHMDKPSFKTFLDSMFSALL